MKKFFFTLFLLLGVSVYSQSPDWSVNVNSFQYSMTFTVFLNVNGTTLTSTNDKVGAFVNGEVRGSANVQFNTATQKHVAFLTVLSNSAGETINFQVYDSTNNVIVNIPTTHTFTIDGNVGSVFQSFSVANPVLKATTVLTSFSFKGITMVSNTISNATVQIEVPSNVDITNLTPVFATQDNAKVFLDKALQASGNETVDFSNDVIFDMLSEDESKIKSYTVRVTKQAGTSPPTISLSSESLQVNTSPVQVVLEASSIISGLTIEDFLTTNCVVTKISSENNKSFNLTVVPLKQGNFSVVLGNNKVVNTNNQGNIASNILQLQVDRTQPVLTRIQRKVPNNVLVKANELVFNVEFSEDVKNVSASDFISVSNSAISVVKISNRKYEVRVQGLDSYSGLVSLGLSDTNNIQDFFGNALQISKFSNYEK